MPNHGSREGRFSRRQLWACTWSAGFRSKKKEGSLLTHCQRDLARRGSVFLTAGRAGPFLSLQVVFRVNRQSNVPHRTVLLPCVQEKRFHSVTTPSFFSPIPHWDQGLSSNQIRPSGARPLAATIEGGNSAWYIPQLARRKGTSAAVLMGSVVAKGSA